MSVDYIDELPDNLPLLGETLPESEVYDPPDYEGGTRFYRLTMYRLPVEFQGGSSIKLPGLVFNGEFQEIKKMQLVRASKKTLNLLIGSKEAQSTGETMHFFYKYLGGFTRSKDKIVDGVLQNKAVDQFKELLWPAMEKMPLPDRNKLQQTGSKVIQLMRQSGLEGVTLREPGTFVYAKVVDEKLNKDGKEWGKFDPKNRVVSIELYPDESSWLKAQEETFSGSSDNQDAANSVDYADILPKDWKSMPEEFKKYFLAYHKEGKVLENLSLEKSERLAEVAASWLEVDAPKPLWPDEVKQYLP